MKTHAFLAGLSTVPIFFSAGSKTDNQPDRPNIVIILADDLGYGDLSCLNSESRIKTPFMDQIAQSGMVFTNAHSPSAVSSPTRYGMLTGEYCFRTTLKSGVLTGYSPSLIDAKKTTIAEMIKLAGYQTACVGKWHLGLDWARKDTTQPLIKGDPWNHPNTENIDYTATMHGGPDDNGFDYSYIIPSSLDITPYVYIRNGKAIAKVADTISGRNTPRGIFWRTGDIQDGFKLETVLETLTSEAVGYLNQQSASGSPFLLYCPLTAPQEPWLPSDSYKGKSGAGTYGDFVTQVDDCVGRVLATLEKKHLDKNTIVIVTSDNGSNWTSEDIKTWNHKGNWIFRGQKSDIWEGGHHIPLLVRWPGKISKGRSTDQLVCLTDFFATFAELTNYRKNQDEGPDSFSFLSSLTGKKPLLPLRTSIIHHSISGMFAITSGSWKFIDGKGSGGWSEKGRPEDPAGQLYNLKSDPSEKTNLFDQNPDIVYNLKNQLNEIKNRSSF
jgi:arylsulfatase A-like enzyme